MIADDSWLTWTFFTPWEYLETGGGSRPEARTQTRSEFQSMNSGQLAPKATRPRVGFRADCILLGKLKILYHFCTANREANSPSAGKNLVLYSPYLCSSTTYGQDFAPTGFASHPPSRRRRGGARHGLAGRGTAERKVRTPPRTDHRFRTGDGRAPSNRDDSCHWRSQSARRGALPSAASSTPQAGNSALRNVPSQFSCAALAAILSAKNPRSGPAKRHGLCSPSLRKLAHLYELSLQAALPQRRPDHLPDQRHGP